MFHINEYHLTYMKRDTNYTFLKGSESESELEYNENLVYLVIFIILIILGFLVYIIHLIKTAKKRIIFPENEVNYNTNNSINYNTNSSINSNYKYLQESQYDV